MIPKQFRGSKLFQKGREASPVRLGMEENEEVTVSRVRLVGALPHVCHEGGYLFALWWDLFVWPVRKSW